MRSFVQFLSFLPELWPLICLEKCTFYNLVLTSLLTVFSFFPTNITNTFFYILFTSHSKKPSSLWLMAYVLCLRVSPFLVKIYKYSPREYAQTFNLTFFVAAAFKIMWRFIFQSFLSSFSASLTYPGVSLKSRYILSLLFIS